VNKKYSLCDHELLDIMYMCFSEAENAVYGFDFDEKTLRKIRKKMVKNHNILAKHLGVSEALIKCEIHK
jgi:uncharacterized radical SAM superfamily Fe-S cluster-containing enzyme